MNPIILSVKRGRFRQDDTEAESADAAFKENRERRLLRDNRTCHYCDFQADKWQQCHHVDDDHHHNELDNLRTVCNICHACYHIGLASMNNGGSLIYLPEISQVALNRLLRAMFVIGKIGSDEWRERAVKMWEFLQSRRKPVCAALGTDDPNFLANALGSATQNDFADRNARLDNIRFLIKPASRMLALPKGGTVIDYWASSVYNKVPEESWMELADQVFDGTH